MLNTCAKKTPGSSRFPASMRLLVVASLLTMTTAAPFPEEDSVVVLDPKNFEDFIKSQDYTIVGSRTLCP